MCKIQGEDGRGHDIASSPLSEANKTMGVWQNLRGDNTKQVKELITKHFPTIHKLATTEMPRRIVWKGFTGALWASVRYGFSTYAITEHESGQILSKLFRPLFP